MNTGVICCRAGFPDGVGECIQEFREESGVKSMALFPMMTGATYEEVKDQLRRLATDLLSEFD